MKQIKDYPNYYVTEAGEVWNFKFKKPKKLNLSTDRDGYLGCTLSSPANRKDVRVHRLVAEAYLPNPLNLPCVCHKDDNPQNNHKDNLFWGTQQDNMDDMLLKGRDKRTLAPKGEDAGHAVLKDQDIFDIRASRLSAKQLAPRYNVTIQTIYDIRHRRTWKHLP